MSVRSRNLRYGSSVVLLALVGGSGCSSDSKTGANGGAGGANDGGLEGGSDASSQAGGATGAGGRRAQTGGATSAGGATGPGTGGSTTTGTGGGTGGTDGGGACTASASCAGTADCIGGSCVPFTACKNSLDCASNQVCHPSSHRCSECVSSADCTGGQECVGAKCVAVTACTSDKQCTPLKQLCDTRLGRCADCLSTADCATGTACSAGACVVALCTPSAVFCDGNAIKTCDPAGQGSTLTKTCAAGQYCDPTAVACASLVCVPGTPACDGTRATRCNALGSAYESGGTDCAAASQACVSGACKSCSGTATASASVRLVEVMVGTPEYVVLENTSGCSVSLNGLTLSFPTSSPAGVTADLALPAQTLLPGEKVFVIDGTAGPKVATTDIATTTNINWQATYGGSVLLCTGPCSGSTVLDALAFQGGAPPPALPSPNTFAPVATTITTTNEQTSSFRRIAFTGTSPTFKPSDWTVGAASRPGSGVVGGCPLTQPTSATPCTTGLSCAYGAVTCICSGSWICL